MSDPVDPLVHTKRVQDYLGELCAHLRQDAAKADEPQFKAMAETAVEVLEGLKKAFRDYEQRDEPAWKAPRPDHDQRH